MSDENKTRLETKLCTYVTRTFFTSRNLFAIFVLNVSQRLTKNFCLFFFFSSILNCPSSLFRIYFLRFKTFLVAKTWPVFFSSSSFSFLSFFYLSSCPSIRCTRRLLMPQGTERFVTCVRQNISGSRPATRSAGSSNTMQPRNSMVHVNTEKKNNWVDDPIFSLSFYRFRMCSR